MVVARAGRGRGRATEDPPRSVLGQRCDALRVLRRLVQRVAREVIQAQASGVASLLAAACGVVRFDRFLGKLLNLIQTSMKQYTE